MPQWKDPFTTFQNYKKQAGNDSIADQQLKGDEQLVLALDRVNRAHEWPSTIHYNENCDEIAHNAFILSLVFQSKWTL